MSTPRLSPAMRAMLRNATHGAPLIKGLSGGPLKNAATRRALEARGLLGQDLKPTDAGRAVFAPKQCEATTEAAPC